MASDEFETLRKQMANDTAARVENFGVPDRFIDGNDVHLWSAMGIVVPNVGQTERFSWPEVVPVQSESGASLGAARILPYHDNLVAYATLDYSCPERLDFQNGAEFAFVARVTKISVEVAQNDDDADVTTYHIGRLVLSQTDDPAMFIDTYVE